MSRTYCATHVRAPSDDHAVLNDTSAFALWLQQESEHDAAMGPYIQHLLTLDQASLSIVLDHAEEAMRFQPVMPAAELTEECVLQCRPLLGRHHVVVQFPVDITVLLSPSPRSEAPPPPSSPTMVLMVKIPGAPRPRIIKINEITYRLLTLLDGSRTGQEALTEMGVPSGEEKAWVVLLLRFYSIGLLRFEA